MSTTLRELDIVFVWYQLKNDEEQYTTHYHGNTTDKETILCYIENTQNTTRDQIINLEINK